MQLVDCISLLQKYLIMDRLFVLSWLMIFSVSLYAQVPLDTAGVYGVMEISFTGPAQTPSSTPNRDIDFWVEFQHETGSPTYRVHGFWDGNGNGGATGNVFKVRFCPTQPGQWNLVNVFSNTPELNNEKEGDFVIATTSSHPGYWMVDAASNGSRWYKRSNGSHAYIMGNTHYDFLSESAGTIAGDVAGNAQYFKKLRFSVTGDLFPNPNQKPFFTASGTQTDDGAQSLRTNPAWFHNRLDQAVSQAYSADLIMDMILAGADAFDARETLKALGNNGDPTPFLKYIAARYGAYPNVWICLANEYDIKNPSYTTAEIRSFGEIIRQYLPFPTPVSVHPDSGTGWQTGLNTNPMWATHKIIQSKDKTLASGASPVSANYNVTPANMPVFNDETGYEGAGDNYSEADIIEGHLGVFSGGGYPTTGYKAIPKEGQYFQGGFDANAHTACDNLLFIREVIDENMAFWNYEPVGASGSIFSGLASAFRVLQWPGNEYVLFSNAADGSISAALPAGAWTVVQYNCISKTTTTIATNATGNMTFSTPAARGCMTLFKKNQPVSLSINSPANGVIFVPGQVVSAQGSGASNLQWTASIQGGATFATGAGESFSFTIPLSASSVSTVVITLSGGGQTVDQAHSVNDTSPDIQPLSETVIAGIPFSIQLVATGSAPSLVWQLNGTVPYGITLSSLGQLEGTLPAVEVISIPVQVTDTDGDTDSEILLLQATAPPDPFCEADGLLVVEAENFHTNSTNGDFVSWNLASSFSGYSGAGYMLTPENNSANSIWSESADLSYLVNIATIGDYYVWLRSRQLDDASNSIYIGWNGIQAGGDLDTGTGTGWGWVRHTVTLAVTTPGEAVFNLRRREDGLHVDKILLTTDPAFVPTGIGPAESTTCSQCSLAINVGHVDPTCSDNNDGAAQLTITGGTLPLVYVWSNGSMESSVNGLGAGTYGVTVTDSNNCTAEATFTLVAPTQLSIGTIATDETLPGANDGIVTATASGGTSPYNYTWSNGATTAGISGLEPGTYTVTVTDGQNCTAVADATIEPAPSGPCVFQESNGAVVMEAENYAELIAQGDPLSWQSADVLGGASGSYMMTPDNGTANRSFTKGSKLRYHIQINTSGTYKMFVRRYAAGGGANSINWGLDNIVRSGTDNGGAYNQWVWIQLGSVAVTAGAHTLELARREDGYAIDRIVFTTGNAPTGVGPAQSNCGSGNNNCTLTVSIAAVSPECHGANSGSAFATASGGAAPVSYVWNNGSTSASIQNLPAGAYTVTATDANGCTAEAGATLSAPPALSLVVASVNESIPGSNNGSASATASGGTPPYAYLWSNGATTAAINNLAPGTYTVTATDANGCTATGSAQVLPGSSSPTYRYLRATVSATNDGNRLRINDFGVVAQGVTHSISNGLWDNSGSGFPQVRTKDLGAGNGIAGVDNVMIYTVFNTSRAPRSFTIEGADSPSGPWTLLCSRSNLPASIFTPNAVNYLSCNSQNLMGSDSGMQFPILESPCKNAGKVGVVLFPNPVMDVLSIRIEGEIPPFKSARIYSATGAEVWRFDANETIDFMSINVSDQVPGIYRLVLMDEQGRVTAHRSFVLIR